jgi:hypothetical protein
MRNAARSEPQFFLVLSAQEVAALVDFHEWDDETEKDDAAHEVQIARIAQLRTLLREAHWLAQ